MKFLLSTILIFMAIISLVQGNDFQSKYQLNVINSSTQIKVDGELNELDWSTAEPIGNFWEKFPSDKIKATLLRVMKKKYRQNESKVR